MCKHYKTTDTTHIFFITFRYQTLNRIRPTDIQTKMKAKNIFIFPNVIAADISKRKTLYK